MLDASVAVFSRRGFHSASMGEIAAVSEPVLYAYLGTKDDVFSSCVRREAQRLMELITSAVPAGLDPRERLRRGLSEIPDALITRLVDVVWTGSGRSTS